MAAGFDVVTVRIPHEPTVIVLVIHGADSGRAVVDPTRGHRCGIEVSDERTSARPKRDVDRLDGLADADPEVRLATLAEAGGLLLPLISSV